jgi:manganese/iron transport system substrate-binding protein
MKSPLYCRLLAVVLLGSASPLWAQASSANKLIVCSTTQIADFTRQIVGDRCQVKCLLSPGADPHLYRPTADDAKLVAAADLCLQNGWHLEGKDWMLSLTQGAKKPPPVTCVDGIEPILLDVDGEKVKVNDPHAWFSPQNAAVYVRNILNAVTQIEPAHKDEFKARAELLLEQIRTLHLWATRQLAAVPPNQRVLVTSHDAFNYFCRAYNFESASPAGWSTAEELGAGVTADSRRKTVESIKSHGVKAIFVETSVNRKLIEQIAKEAGVRIGGELYSDSMGEPGTPGESYIGMMRENVLTIVGGLK